MKNIPVKFILELGLVGLYQVWEKVRDFNEFLLCILMIMTVGLSGESKEWPKHAEPNRAGPLVSNITYLCKIVAKAVYSFDSSSRASPRTPALG